MKEIGPLLQDLLRQIRSADSLTELEGVRVASLGKKGVLTQRIKALATLSAEERPIAGKEVNQAKHEVRQAISLKKKELEGVRFSAGDGYRQLDVSLPGRGVRAGGLHPITQTLRRIERFFEKAGFSVVDGPEIEDDYHNFIALNIPESHPARAMHDTFYFSGGLLLRTHTSSVQIRVMKDEQPPFQFISSGRVYRRDSDMMHTPMFHQVEGVLVSEQITFSDLKALLINFLACFFDRELETRFRPSYFPFTEPSAEVDIMGKNGWLEVLGCGMVHPNVLGNVGIDPNRYSGLAFGMGVERLAMLYYGVDDLRLFFENDLRFLKQFNHLSC